MQEVKPDLKQMRKKMSSYFIYKLTTLRQRKVLQHITEEYNKNQCPDEEFNQMLEDEVIDEGNPVRNYYENYTRFPLRTDIQQRHQDGRALCGFFNRDAPNTIFVAHGNSRKRVDFVKINYDLTDSIILTR